MTLADLWALELLLAAFAGGAFGAAIGALPAFTLTGVMVVVGETHAVVRRSLATAADPVAIGEAAITGSIAFGPVLGPHVSFGGGAAAAAYAAKRGYLETDFAYHEAKHVTTALGSRPDVLLVGGCFGIVGYWIATLSSALAAPVDPVALGVVGSAFAHRVALGYSLIGDLPRDVFDMSPDGDAATDGGRNVVEPWLPYQCRWGNVVVLGLVVGVLGAYVAYLTASPFLAFGITVAALVFLNAGVARVPVTHHMALPASTVVVAMAPAGRLATPEAIAGALGLGEALVLGACFGAIGALAGEALQRLLYAHAETHLDPPAASIVVTSLLIALLAAVGVLPDAAWIAP